MSKRVDLFGNVLPPPERRRVLTPKKSKGVLYPWTDICCKACFFAVRDKCTCRCGGAHHGEGRVVKGQKKLEGEEDRD